MERRSDRPSFTMTRPKPHQIYWQLLKQLCRHPWVSPVPSNSAMFSLCMRAEYFWTGESPIRHRKKPTRSAGKLQKKTDCVSPHPSGAFLFQFRGSLIAKCSIFQKYFKVILLCLHYNLIESPFKPHGDLKKVEGRKVALAGVADKSGHWSHSSPVIWMLCLGSACLDDQCLSLAYFLVSSTPKHCGR